MQNYAIEQSFDLTLRQRVGSKLVPTLYSDYAESTGFEISNETLHAKRRGVKAIVFKKNREGKINYEFEIYSMKQIALFLGASQIKGTSKIHKVEKHIVETAASTKKFTVRHTPIVDSLSAYSVLPDGVTHDKALEVTVSGSDVTVTTSDITEGTNVICYYLTASGEKSITTSIKSNEFAKNFNIIGSTINKNENGEEGELQYEILNAAPDGSISLNFGGDISKLSMSFEILPDPITNEMVVFTEIDTP